MQEFDVSQLPSPFYRVTVKGLIFDEQKRLLVCVNDEGGYEIPGGGMEYGEDVQSCLARELFEELGLHLDSSSEIVCVYDMRSPFRNVPVIRIAVRASIQAGLVRPGDSIVDYRYVTRDEFMHLDLRKYEGPIQDYADSIWG